MADGGGETQSRVVAFWLPSAFVGGGTSEADMTVGAVLFLFLG
jgi:hypothetical protein